MPKRREAKKKILTVPGRGRRWFGKNRQQVRSQGKKGPGNSPNKKPNE